MLGALSVSKRPGEQLTPAEDKLIGDLAAQVGLILRNVGLTEQLSERLADLRASRRRIVTAQDDQRRRIERDLRDGAQRQLLAVASGLTLAESLAGRDAERERALVAQLKSGTRDALESLRDLARGVYPPLLADQGLAHAVGAHAGKAPLPVIVDADAVGRYPADIETAVYFCCVEAVANAARHAPQATVRIRLRGSAEDVSFAVEDDGPGFDRSRVRPGGRRRRAAAHGRPGGRARRVAPGGRLPRGRHRRHRADPGHRGARAGSIRASGRGSHQFAPPSSSITAGTSTSLTSVASISTATARPRPTCLTETLAPAANERNTTIMIAAAAEITRAVLASLDRHRHRPEHHGQQHHRDRHHDRDQPRQPLADHVGEGHVAGVRPGDVGPDAGARGGPGQDVAGDLIDQRVGGRVLLAGGGVGDHHRRAAVRAHPDRGHGHHARRGPDRAGQPPSTVIATVAAAATATPFSSGIRSTSRPSIPIATIAPTVSTLRPAVLIADHHGVFCR